MKASTALTVIGSVLLAGSAALGIWQAAAPEEVSGIVGDVKVGIERGLYDLTAEEVPAEIAAPPAPERAEELEDTAPPASGTRIAGSVRLSGEGGMPELDRCDGSFIELVAYRGVDGVLPVHAAHNKCRGDVILTWKTGDIVKVDGALHRIVELRTLPKSGRVSELAGMGGDLVLQTCVWRKSLIRFVSLEAL